eukprot:TRINITY_DN2869_c0_g1_i1.p1 TRINITY_DN2869_c0_g1~~TRINITY_DN2869_c0_g1_i1.p1  ORF type:complete len:564 (+),score=96.53 TRINITY_DN2869_c0_g1_i1:55-1746(+)
MANSTDAASAFINIQQDDEVELQSEPSSDAKWTIIMLISALCAPALGVTGGVVMKETTSTDDVAVLYTSMGLWGAMFAANVPLLFVTRSKYFLMIFVANIVLSILCIIMTFVTVGLSDHVHKVRWYIAASVLYVIIYHANNLVLLVYKDKRIEETTPTSPAELQSPISSISETTPLVTKSEAEQPPPKPAPKKPAAKKSSSAINERQRWWTFKEITATLGIDQDLDEEMSKQIPKDEFLKGWNTAFSKTNEKMVKWGTLLYNSIDRTGKGYITMKQLSRELDGYTTNNGTGTDGGKVPAPEVVIQRKVPPAAVPDVNTHYDCWFIAVSICFSLFIVATFFVIKYVDYVKLWFIMMGFTGGLFLAYCIILRERRYWAPLKNTASMHALNDRLAQIRARPARLLVTGTCYHYKTTTTKTTVGGVSIKSSDREKVVSQKFQQVFPTTKVKDNSDLPPVLSDCDLVAVSIATQYCFATKSTREKFKAFQNEFNDKHRNKDNCYEFGAKLDIPGLETSVLGMRSTIWWITWYYYVHTWLIPPLVYLWRRAYDRKVKKTKYTVCKQYWA